MVTGKTFCIFTAHYLPNLGGVERYNYNLATHLVAMGHRVIIVTSNVYNLDAVETDADGAITIYRLPCFKLLNGRFPVLRKNRAFRTLNKQLLAEQIDYAIVNCRFYVHSLYAVQFAAKMRIPCILIEHVSNHFTVNNRFFDFFGHVYEHIITFLIKRYSVQYYGVSEACNRWFLHFNIYADGIIYNAVDMDAIDNLISNAVSDYRNDYSIGSSDIVVTYAGRLIKEKGALELIESINHIKRENVYLFIAGDGPLRDELLPLQSKNVILLGHVAFPAVIALLSQSDIFCLPSDYPEGFPTSLLEAAACGCYCIATACGKELIIDDSYGYIIASRAYGCIASAIDYAVLNPAHRLSAAMKLQNRVRDNFQWRAVAQKVVDVFS